MAVVISDSSPLICLAAIWHFRLLRLLYSDVLIPDAVWQEITRAPVFAAAASLQAATDARDAGWLQVGHGSQSPPRHADRNHARPRRSRGDCAGDRARA